MLLRTKFALPLLRTNLIERPRLRALFAGMLHVPLTLVSAPAGFGKTTAVLGAARAVQFESGCMLAWLTLDEQDNDPAVFWRYVAAALREANGDAERLFPEFPATLPVRALSTMLLNRIAEQAAEFLLVLDDYQQIEQADIHTEFSFLIEHVPVNLHLVLITRADPPLPLHRLRSRGLLLDIRAGDLRFTPVESAALLNGALALALNDTELDALDRQTEGWIAGLHLAGLAIKGAPADRTPDMLIERLAHSNRYIIEYLTEEILAQQQATVQDFLLRTSILPALCAGLCDAALQIQGSAALLELLEQRNLFLTPIGALSNDDERWLRYHPLFAALLQGQFRRRFAGQAAALHLRAAEWYAQRGDAETAIDQALLGEHFDYAITLINRYARSLAMQGRILTIERWLQRFPEPMRRSMPQADLAFAWALLIRGRYNEIEPYLEHAAATSTDSQLAGEIGVLRATLLETRGRLDEALAYAERALGDIPPDDVPAAAVAYTTLANIRRAHGNVAEATAAYERAVPLCRAAGLILPELLGRAHLGYLYIIQGTLHAAEAITRAAFPLFAEHPAVSPVRQALAEVLIEWNQLDEAEQLVRLALEQAEQSGHTAALVRGWILHARLSRAHGDHGAAQAALERAAPHIPHAVPAWIEPLFVAEQVHCLLAQDSIDAAARCIGQRGTRIDPAEGHVRDLLPLARARLLYRQGKYAEALIVLDAVQRDAEPAGRRGRLIEALIVKTLTYAAAHDPSAAQTALRRALSLAAPEGYLRSFLEAGPALLPLLSQIDNDTVRRLLNAFMPGRSGTPAPPRAPDDALLEPLSEREVEVLRLIAQGLTYQQIADRLIISVNTVRHHIKGIYGKLQVDRRTHAIERAHALHIL